ncbi:hypothetical protein WP3W18E02_20990 [Klebsiella sp. WP3-W18-ESBL-02]|uniref:Uncharacterized protein n=1 Tax=Kluyvera genomosp. 2 TaxID=2774054 RepID=A0A2T2XWW0_9ENTR|nr:MULTISPECIES: hypothetical protein [Enterobacteriaceae]PSR44737.1 hypothetical protein C8256_21495 [Kluyvera genomosp. 2]BBQ83570.1 hypothetical protein WP3W18E02_20990 [Klebsiella sp. WP3-W18-ESBL-02]BBR20593.1 hypothetical protein WP3S18E05_20730 [Klebsiella sp. WP3-S18-ESBL-05]
MSERVVVENNHLSQPQQQSRSEEIVACGSDSSCKTDVRKNYAKEYDIVQEKIKNCSSAADCVAVAKEMKEWKAESSARSDELAAKARNEGIDSLTQAEKLEWANLRGAQSNFDGSINTLIYRAQMFGGSEETSAELVNIFGHAAIANAAGAAAGISKAKSNNQPNNRIETVLKPEKNWESARNKALDIVGNLGDDSKPVIGRLEVSAGNGKVIGRQSSDGKLGWRVDYDPEKGTHINIWDYSQGKGPGKAVKQVIPFDGNEKSFETILKQLNR